jgi:polyphosphate kinase 2
MTKKDDHPKTQGTLSLTASNGHQHAFDLDDPDLPHWIKKAEFKSGGYPHDEPMDDRDYEKQLHDLQIELVKLQTWTIATGERMAILLEGRDAAGKGGIIDAFKEYASPRMTRVIALQKPNDHELGQWYFQRYVQHLPRAGEIVLFDRSWYNRAGVEKVMGFATAEQVEQFLHDAPRFEALMTNEGIRLIKIFVDVGFEMQLKRFHDRRHNPLKVWKISDIDRQAMLHYADYTAARDRMLEMTHNDLTPWTVVFGNDKRRARLAVMRHILGLFEYPGKDRKAIGQVDDKILGHGPGFALDFAQTPK